MANISSLSLPQLVDLVDRRFTDVMLNFPKVMRGSGVVIEDPLEQQQGLYKRYAERVHMSSFASRRGEGDSTKIMKTQYGYEKDMTVYTRAGQIEITKLMRLAGKNQQIKDKINELTTVVPNGIELDLAHRLTFAWSTSYTDRDGVSVDVTTGDGLALISASHTLTGSATTYSNQIPNNPAFSKTALTAAEKLAVEQTFDNLGVKRNIPFDTIITTDDPDTVIAVKELLNATADTASSNSGTFNVYKNAKKHVIVPAIATDANGGVDTNKRKYWFLASSTASDFYYSELEAPYVKSPQVGNNGEDFSTENWSFLNGGTYGMAIVTGRWVKGSKGDAS